MCTDQAKTVLNKNGDEALMDFFTGGSVIIYWGFIFWPVSDDLKLKPLNNNGFVSYKQTAFCLIDGLEWCGLLWCFFQLFGLSFWRHPFTAEDPLVSKWFNATFIQIWWRNKLIYFSNGLTVNILFDIFSFSLLYLIWI